MEITAAQLTVDLINAGVPTLLRKSEALFVARQYGARTNPVWARVGATTQIRRHDVIRWIVETAD